VSLDELDKKKLREKIGYISQNIFLFNSTLRENILLGKECSDEELERILRECKLEERIRKKGDHLSNSLLDIEVSEKGINFSGGERQLIALARALVKKPEVIILDEAVANLDIETAKEIEGMIDSKFKNSIIIKISHRGEQKGWRVIELKS
jgi:ABC-type multidrug transport system fused ATPase/permease subunit